jgi:hypothetical protein
VRVSFATNDERTAKRVRATGQGICFNVSRALSAVGPLGASIDLGEAHTSSAYVLSKLQATQKTGAVAA